MTFALVNRLEIAPGIVLWPAALDGRGQAALSEEVFARAAAAPFYRPSMPGSGKPFSVEETNFGPLGWVSDKGGYRYARHHPLTHLPWPDIPPLLAELWRVATDAAPEPECCLVNFYRDGARMGLHQDRDEEALEVPVVSISLGDEAVFRIGGTTRKSATRSLRLKSGDVLAFGGPARLAFHGVDRVLFGSSGLVPGGGRLNLTLRRVRASPPIPRTGPDKKDARPGG